MPESVFTQTMPSLLARGVCCCVVEAGLAGVEEADEFDGVGIAVGVGLVAAGAEAREPAGAELAAGVFSAAVSADFLERDFFVLPVSGAAVASALAALSLWLLFAVFWSMIVPLVTEVVVPIDPFDPRTELQAINVAQGLNRLSPNTLFAETTLALLNPGTRTLGPVFVFQLQGAVLGAPLPVAQSFLLIWPQLTGLIAAVVLLFTLGYVLFQRQEIRA